METRRESIRATRDQRAGGLRRQRAKAAIDSDLTFVVCLLFCVQSDSQSSVETEPPVPLAAVTLAHPQLNHCSQRACDEFGGSQR